ncbi:hypothetical protein IE53DRAFT_370910 [Violaceomyces palustris]|uniref:Uncharacterized protein n=1 Tax=Violaceomyces palustris TaxID=1673888 RepID=A0ACD0NQH3_9BASI|nr:hypothetical protein IE53DRAFT_370910 [Violaceomyces palustris]
MAQAPPQQDIPDSPSSGFFEFPLRRQAHVSSEEAANAALAASGAASSLSDHHHVHLQAVLIRSASSEAVTFPSIDSIKGRSSKNVDASGGPPNKKRFSFDALRIGFRSRKLSKAVVEEEPRRPRPDSQKHSRFTKQAKKRQPSEDRNELSILDSNTSDVLTPVPVTEIEEADLVDQDLPSIAIHQPSVISAQDAPDELGPVQAPTVPGLSRTSSNSRARCSSNHRVSFSPSTDEAIAAREQAALVANQQREKETRKERKREDKAQRKAERERHKLERSRSSSPRMMGLRSLSSTSLLESVHSLDPRRRSVDELSRSRSHGAYTWDKRGISEIQGGKAKAAKAKVSKQQAIAARHAKTLEQVINAGTGLHPAIPTKPDEVDPKTGKQRPLKSRPVPVVKPSQLKGLKSALLDVELANGIIGELRAMQIPLPIQGTTKADGCSSLPTPAPANDHSERIIAAPIPEAMEPALHTRDDSDIPEESLPDARLSRPGEGGQEGQVQEDDVPLHPTLAQVRACSPAEEALKRIEDPSRNQKLALIDMIRRRSTSRGASGLRGGSTSSTPTTSVKVHATRPLKAVCLDCGELDAHKRHFEQGVQTPEASSSRSEETRTVATEEQEAETETVVVASTSFYSGAAAAGALLGAGLGGLLSKGSATAPPAADESGSKVSNGRTEDVEPIDAEPTRPKGHRPERSFSFSSLPTLADGQALLGSTPVSLLTSPQATLISTYGQSSGAFDALAGLSGAAIRATTDMDSIHPPLDRMSIFVHWWGFELTLPKPTMAYLNTAHSVSGAFLSFLQTMVVSGGVPELLPFVKYISMYMDVEFKAIQAQDKGTGVVVAATWFMPLALVPRPWDYPLTPPPEPAPTLPNPPPPPASQATENLVTLEPLLIPMNHEKSLPNVPPRNASSKTKLV